MNIFFIVVGLALILINYIPIKNKDNSFKNILKKQDNLTRDYDIELMLIRKDMAESILELQKEIEELRQSINHNNNDVNTYDTKDEDNTNNVVKENQDSDSTVCNINFNNKKSNDTNSKTDIIRQMINAGYSDEDICRELKIGKGEVLLIRGLYKWLKKL